MALDTTLDVLVTKLPLSLAFIGTSILLVLAILITAHIYTTIRYRLTLSIISSPTSNSTKATPPPRVPYTLPFLGHALSFLAPRPGEFWAHLFSTHPRSTGACTLLLGGKTTHILFSPSAVRALFKNRGIARDSFNFEIAVYGLGCEKEEARKYYGSGEGPDHTGRTPVQQQERMNHNYMLERKSVNELTAEFTRVLGGDLEGELGSRDRGSAAKEVGFYAWLQELMFKASTTAFMGSRILECYPNLREDFFDFDRHMLTMFFRVPKFLSPTAYNVRERALNGLMRWHEQMQEECNGIITDPDGDIDWEPVYGSRANRARQSYYANRGLNFKTRAGMDLGLLFALSSNAIPATGWMLMHILNPQGDPTLHSRIMAELVTAERGDGSLDIPTLVGLPLLQSVYHEVLRLYVDVLVTRELKHDLALPLDEAEKRHVLLNGNTIVMAPSWLGHRDEALWMDPPCHQFHAERFLKTDPETGTQIFSTSGTNGKFFPFGGGKTICPGRVFAKQEVLGAVAMVLLRFEIEVLGFVDDEGKSTENFPGLRKSYLGSGIMATDADMRVRIKERKR